MTTAAACTLSKQDVLRFHEEGYLGPYALCTPAEMAAFRERIEREVLTKDGPNPRSREHCRHLDCRLIYDLVTHPAIIERMTALFGPDIVIWSSNFWTKQPGGGEIPWHQDFNYWPLNPHLNLSAWMAIDACTEENSCVRIIPGSHKKILQHVKATEGMAFSEMAQMQGIDVNKAVRMVLQPGEFFFFNERTLHQSNKNVSNKRRMGLAARLTLPFVKLNQEGPPLFPGHNAILVHGEDRFGINRYQDPPVA
ncbi:MAG: phytanoyl-CoA dioxygenase family protein [Planctomycetes bacterium]|nr:phytanoyl-CoA dioxygenase family protein [Planctomycetota bacterium]